MGARPTRKKTRIAERRENLVVSLSVSFIARAPRFDPHQKRRCWSPSNSLKDSNSKRAANSNRTQKCNSNSCARELEITEFRRDTRSEKQQQQKEDERKERRVRKRTFARRCCARGLCLFCSELLENSKGRRRRKKPLTNNGQKKLLPPQKEKQTL